MVLFSHARNLYHSCAKSSQGQSEEQIKEICGTVGQVVGFRPIYDNETGRPRGYGFVEYVDADAAASAVRNLNGYKIEGRELRVDFSKRGDGEDSGAQSSHNHQGSASNLPHQPLGAAAAANGIGPLPPGIELPPGVTCADAISKTLSTLPPPQLLDILSQMKGLVTGDPSKATELLRQAPQLSYAIFQALLLMGLVDSQLIAQVVQQAAANGAGPGVEMGGGDPNQHHRPPPAGVPPPPPPAGYTQTPPVGQTPFQPPVPALPPGQKELLDHVLSMPQSEIDKLAPAERAQIMALRQQFAGQRY